VPADAETLSDAGAAAGLQPKVITLGKALLFRVRIDAPGELANGLSTGSVDRTVQFSSVDEAEREGAAEAYEASHEESMDAAESVRACLFEVAADALKRSKSWRRRTCARGRAST